MAPAKQEFTQFAEELERANPVRTAGIPALGRPGAAQGPFRRESLAASKLNLPQKETPPRGARAFSLFSLGSRHRKWEEAVKRSDYAKGRV
jgi:hypothetical protein